MKKVISASNNAVKIRLVRPSDTLEIQRVEKEFYEGSSCLLEVLGCWIESLPENFLVARVGGKIVGFIFFEYLNCVKALPFIHNFSHQKNGAYAYVSDVGVSDGFSEAGVLQKLLDEMLKKSVKDGIKAVVWLTGNKRPHDKVEQALLIKNGFIRGEKVEKWESSPGHFVTDHALWTKKIASE